MTEASTVDLVRLHRDPVEVGIRVEELPRWIAPGQRGVYWHQPRSASQRETDAGHGHAEGDYVIHAWCGQTLFRTEAEVFVPIDPPLVDRCGTCLGRKLGYDRAEGAIFQPRDHWALPRWCPGRSGDDGFCVACGFKVRCCGGYMPHECPHAPTPLLLERVVPCPRHGWKEMRTSWSDGRIVCGTWRCDHVG